MEKGLRGLAERMSFKTNIIAIFENKKTGERKVIECHNIVGNEGDKHYAQKGAAETPSMAFDSMYLGTTATPSPTKTSTYASLTLVAGSEKLVKATYPKTNDADSDNTGAGVDVVTWTFEYAAADGNWTGITEGVIGLPTNGGTGEILTHFSFGGSFSKDSNTTLKVIVNHTANGV